MPVFPPIPSFTTAEAPVAGSEKVIYDYGNISHFDRVLSYFLGIVGLVVYNRAVDC